MARYRFETEWRLDAPVDRVWDVLLRVRDWPTWWRGFRSVEPLDPGDDDGVGMRVRQGWRSRLPYTLAIELEILAVEQKRRLVGRASGDLRGTCDWTFEQRDGRTVVTFVMDVEPTRWWMRLPVPFAGRVFAWNASAIMGWGHEGLVSVLGPAPTEPTVRAGFVGV
jgi:hypothetical protein